MSGRVPCAASDVAPAAGDMGQVAVSTPGSNAVSTPDAALPYRARLFVLRGKLLIFMGFWRSDTALLVRGIDDLMHACHLAASAARTADGASGCEVRTPDGASP